MDLKVEHAEKLIKIARDAISAYFEGKEYEVPAELKKEFKYERGVFVTLYVKNALKGCIGYPEPIMPLAESVANCAKAAAFEDVRFPSLKQEQVKDLRVELSILTEPQLIEVSKASDYLKKIEIGKDGLIVKDEYGSGLLLPQVPVEWKWDVKEFLDNTCRKAGLEPSSWKNMRKSIYKFQAQIFTEENGKIVEKKLEINKA
jgi:uncharacterized protein